jgi:hypothetical protein
LGNKNTHKIIITHANNSFGQTRWFRNSDKRKKHWETDR